MGVAARIAKIEKALPAGGGVAHVIQFDDGPWLWRGEPVTEADFPPGTRFSVVRLVRGGGAAA